MRFSRELGTIFRNYGLVDFKSVLKLFAGSLKNKTPQRFRKCELTDGDTSAYAGISVAMMNMRAMYSNDYLWVFARWTCVIHFCHGLCYEMTTHRKAPANSRHLGDRVFTSHQDTIKSEKKTWKSLPWNNTTEKWDITRWVFIWAMVPWDNRIYRPVSIESAILYLTCTIVWWGRKWYDKCWSRSV